MNQWAHAEYPGRGRQKYHIRGPRFRGALCGATLLSYGSTETPTGKLCRTCVALSEETAK